MKKTHISLRRETALEILNNDNDDGEFDYHNYSDQELFDAFVGAGYFADESEIYGNDFVTITPENCLDARTVGDVTGWPISLDVYYDEIIDDSLRDQYVPKD